MKYTTRALLVKILAVVCVTMFVVGCEKEEDDKIAGAQACLNAAKVPADAAACKAMLNGINTERGNRILCFLEMLGDGVSEDSIIEAYKKIDDNTQDPVIQVGTGLGLSDLNTDTLIDAYEVSAAQSIKSVCYKTTSTGLKTMSQLILFGTQAKFATQANGGDPTDPSSIATNIANMSDADAGQFAVDVFQLYCVPTFTNDSICNSLLNSGANDPTNIVGVGSDLKACLVNNTCR